jgi:hypothetical protein
MPNYLVFERAGTTRHLSLDIKSLSYREAFLRLKQTLVAQASLLKLAQAKACGYILPS